MLLKWISDTGRTIALGDFQVEFLWSLGGPPGMKKSPNEQKLGGLELLTENNALHSYPLYVLDFG